MSGVRLPAVVEAMLVVPESHIRELQSLEEVETWRR